MPWKIDYSTRKGKKVAVRNEQTGKINGYSDNPKEFLRALYANEPTAAKQLAKGLKRGKKR